MDGCRITGLPGTVFSPRINRIFFSNYPKWDITSFKEENREKEKNRCLKWLKDVRFRIVYYNFKENFKFIILLSRIKVHNSLFERNQKD